MPIKRKRQKGAPPSGRRAGKSRNDHPRRADSGRSGQSHVRLRPKLVKVQGRFEGHPRGFGFVTPETGHGEDVFIPAKYVGEALHGDVVEVLFHPHGRRGKPWGEVVRVIAPTEELVVGRFDGCLVVPRDPRFSSWVRVDREDAGLAAAGAHIFCLNTS
jgi:exoribonuclease R